MAKLLVGPLLGLESDKNYTVCFLTEKSVAAAAVLMQAGRSSIAGRVVGETKSGKFWRAEIDIQLQAASRSIDYAIALDGAVATDQAERDSWTFFVPGEEENPLMSYASCNGFSSGDLSNKTEDPYAQWRRMAEMHEENPFSLMIMGGDQIYADEVWTKVDELKAWSDLREDKRRDHPASAALIDQLEDFYDKLYQQRWRDENMSLMLASVPSVMMWDDHDIFDGWGSYPHERQICPVFQAIFGAAKHHFELFQIRSRDNKSLLAPDAAHYAFALKFRGQHILGLDNRAERTLLDVMSPQQWDVVNRALKDDIGEGNLFVLSAVPVVYRDFSFIEAVVDATPWEEELTDDLKDHWRSNEHEGERARLIMRLLENCKKRGNGKTVLLSGDVHIGCLGAIIDERDGGRKIHQVVSSGIVHPAPSRIQWFGIMASTNDRTEYLNEDRTISVRMLKPYGSDQYIRSRNFVTLETGSDGKLWINWICENGRRPSYPLD